MKGYVKDSLDKFSYPEEAKAALRRAYADWIRRGKKFGGGIGVYIYRPHQKKQSILMIEEGDFT